MKLGLCIVVAVPVLMSQPATVLGTRASVVRGDKLFAQGCAVGYCHGAGGSAARSPRLRGRTFERDYLIKVIQNGIPNTAMPAWGDRLTDADINDLSDYIQSLANAPVEVTAGPASETVLTTTAEQPSDIPDEYRAGRDLFFDLTRTYRCSICHRLSGRGQAAGPDITNVAALKVADGPQVLRYGRPRTVRTYLLTTGERFAGVTLDRGAAFTRVYDLTSPPPVLRNLMNTDIQAVQRATTWRHGNVVRGYSLEEMQQIWNYVRFVAAKK